MAEMNAVAASASNTSGAVSKQLHPSPSLPPLALTKSTASTGTNTAGYYEPTTPTTPSSAQTSLGLPIATTPGSNQNATARPSPGGPHSGGPLSAVQPQANAAFQRQTRNRQTFHGTTNVKAPASPVSTVFILSLDLFLACQGRDCQK